MDTPLIGYGHDEDVCPGKVSIRHIGQSRRIGLRNEPGGASNRSLRNAPLEGRGIGFQIIRGEYGGRPGSGKILGHLNAEISSADTRRVVVYLDRHDQVSAYRQASGIGNGDAYRMRPLVGHCGRTMNKDAAIRSQVG